MYGASITGKQIKPVRENTEEILSKLVKIEETLKQIPSINRRLENIEDMLTKIPQKEQ